MLKEVKIEITNLCERNCKHCSSDATCDNDNQLFLEKEIIKNVIDQIYEMKAMNVVFTGGEATLHPDILEIVRYAKQLGFRTKLYTMCYRTEKNIELLQILNKNGLDEIIYSTAIELVVSKELSTYTIEEFINVLSNTTNLLIGFHHVVTSDTLGSVSDIPKYIGAAGCNLNKMSFLRYVPHGRGTYALIPSKEQMEYFKKQLIELKGKYKDNVRIGSPFNVLNITSTICNAAEETMIVGFDGKVYPCDAMKYFDYFGSGGNIYENSLIDIYNSKYFKDIRILKNNHGTDCIKCHNYSLCMGGCLGQKMICSTSFDETITLEWYEVNAKRTMNNFSSPEVMKLNARLGIAGETGELLDCMKKLLTHNCNAEGQEKIKKLMIDEMGDLMWYIASSLSTYYNISFNEIGYRLFGGSNTNAVIDHNMIKHCASQRDPECPYLKTNKSYSISKIDELIRKKRESFSLSKLCEDLDVVAFKLRRSDDREDIINLSSKLVVILGKICYSLLDTTIESVLAANILRLQERYPMGFDREKASARIHAEEIYKNDQICQESYIKKK